MKQIGPEKSSVAWFRLAECLKRKERERAFLLYRLLMHSFEDHAFLKKLEGDMWIDFDEQEAVACYLASAHYYKKREEYYEAYLIYKRLFELDHQNLSYIDLIIEIIDHTPFRSDKSLYCAKKLSILCSKDLYVQAHEFFQEKCQFLSLEQKNNFYKEFIIHAINAGYNDATSIEGYLQQLLSNLAVQDQTNTLQQFLTVLQTQHNEWHKKAQMFLH